MKTYLIGAKTSSGSKSAKINWETLYPFNEHGLTSGLTHRDSNNKSIAGMFLMAKEMVKKAERKVTELFPYRAELARVNSQINKALGMRLFTQFENTVLLKNGYFHYASKLIEMRERASRVSEFNQFLLARKIGFFYVQTPLKNGKHSDQMPSGLKDFSSQNLDNFLRCLKEFSVVYLDLRDELFNDNLNHFELFFKTDHHWKPETGLLAAGKVASYLQQRYAFPIDSSFKLVDFRVKNYPKCFLGSQGKKVTLAFAEPEDLSVIEPKWPTDLEIFIPSLNFSRRGSFGETVLEKDALKFRGYNDSNPYAVYLHGDQPLISVRNHKSICNKKILVVKDSFANAMVPFLSLGVKNIDTIDLRYFSGSLKSYIVNTRPDVVFMLYSSPFSEEKKFFALD